jgi:hypothetical protein
MSLSPRYVPRLLSIVVSVVVFTALAVSLSPHTTAPAAARPHRLVHAAPASSQSVPAYYAVASDGGIFAFGGLTFWGSMGGHPLWKPMVGIAPTATPAGATGLGYWTVASDGGIFSFGNAQFHGSMGGHPLNQPMVGIAADPVTGGYWTVASDGGVFAFDAPFHGSLGNIHLNKPIIALAPTPDGGGYWMFASDGGVFAFGDAGFYGSTGGINLTSPVVGAAATPDGRGYWLVAADGGVFAYGDAAFEGSLGGHALKHPIVSMTAADMNGYWLTDSNGAVTAFGDAGYFGSAPQHLTSPVVSMADGPGTGFGGNEAYPSGSYGYDISKYQDNGSCTATLPSGHIVGIVQATGDSGGAPNPCLAHEAAWAGAGLNLYSYMTYGTSTTDEPGCNGDVACNFGYQAALFAYNYVTSQQVNPLVTWWLDVESDPSWSSNTTENMEVVQGAINGLRGQGINNVGIYASPDNWNTIVGDYQPPVPMWVAWWTYDSGPYNCQNIKAYAASRGDLLPTGPVFVTQYTNQANGPNAPGLDGDYAC